MDLLTKMAACTTLIGEQKYISWISVLGDARIFTQIQHAHGFQMLALDRLEGIN